MNKINPCINKKIILAALIIVLLILIIAGCKGRRVSSDNGYNDKSKNTFSDYNTFSYFKPGDYRESISVDGRSRTYLLHVPSGYKALTPLPLVIAFHGFGGDGKSMAELSKLSALADKENFFVAYPDGFERSWNHGDGARPAVKENIDDVKFVRTLIETLEKKLEIDNARIFATGFSNGALMTERLGCELADVLAGIAPVSGSLPKKIASSCKPAKPVLFHLIYGVADPLSPYNGGTLKSDGGDVLSVKDTLSFWGKHNGCLSKKEEKLSLQVNDGTSVTKTVYHPCTGAGTVLYSIEGGGHAWPPSSPRLQPITGKSSKNIDATKVIWEFFKAHPKQ